MLDDCKRGSIPLLAVSLIAAAALIGSALVLKRTELAPAWRVAVALAPLPFYIAMFVVTVRVTRRLDELKRRIQIEALAVGMIGTLLVTVSYGMLLMADIGLAPLDWSVIWIVATAFYAVGTFNAWRRYR